jgi:hypothetical protein
MNDKDQDRSQAEGQEGIDKETELRNRENESGQSQGQQFGQSGQSGRSGQPQDQQFGQSGQPGQLQDQQFGQSGQPGQSPSDQQRGEGFGRQAGQAVERSDTALADRQDETSGQQSSSEAGGFVGTQGDSSSDYLTKGEEGQDFAEQGQGAQDSSSGRSDIETGQAQEADSDLDGGSTSDR